MSKARAINWVVYGLKGTPKGVSPARWAAMVAHINREVRRLG
jgi:hypothetical protein